jgi:hypothetical protein
MFNNLKVKKIVNVYQLKYVNKIAQGFGDFLRGCICLYDICQRINIAFDIDFSNHPISHFIIGHKYNETIKYNNIEWYDDNNFSGMENGYPIKKKDFLYNFILDLTRKNENIYYLGCNSFPIINDNDTNQMCKDFIKSKIMPNLEMMEFINEKIISLNLENKKYNIIHIRTGDKYLLDESKLDEKYLKFIIEKFLNILKEDNISNFVLISDCNQLKNILKKYEIPNLIIYFSYITHLGEDSLKTIDSVKGTLLDFYIMSKAEKIYSLSPYSWGSGFSKWCSIIYNIKYISIPLDYNIYNGNNFDEETKYLSFNEYFYENFKSIFTDIPETKLPELNFEMKKTEINWNEIQEFENNFKKIFTNIPEENKIDLNEILKNKDEYITNTNVDIRKNVELIQNNVIHTSIPGTNLDKINEISRNINNIDRTNIELTQNNIIHTSIPETNLDKINEISRNIDNINNINNINKRNSNVNNNRTNIEFIQNNNNNRIIIKESLTYLNSTPPVIKKPKKLKKL